MTQIMMLFAPATTQLAIASSRRGRSRGWSKSTTDNQASSFSAPGTESGTCINPVHPNLLEKVIIRFDFGDRRAFAFYPERRKRGRSVRLHRIGRSAKPR